jgi:hypothetical protein
MVDHREGDEPVKLRWKPDVDYVSFDADFYAICTDREFHNDFVDGAKFGKLLQRQMRTVVEGEWVPNILPAPLMGQRTPAAATPHHEGQPRAGIKVAVGDEVNIFIGRTQPWRSKLTDTVTTGQHKQSQRGQRSSSIKI